MKFDNYKLFRMTLKDATWFWTHMRPEDKKEVEIMGTTLEAWKENLQSPKTESFVLRLGGERMACGGWTIAQAAHPKVPNLLLFWFVCTPSFSKYLKSATKAAQTIVDNVCKDPQYFAFRKVVKVWSGHTQALKWVRMLGFRRLLAYQPVGNGETSIYIISREEGKPFKQLINDKYGYERIKD